MAFEDYTAGDVFTAASADLIMRQGIMVFATESERDTDLSGNLNEGMFAYTSDTNSVWYYSGAAWKPFYAESWTSFTPSWTNVTVGNATQNNGWYRYEAGGMRVAAWFQFGSSSAFTGSVSLAVPNGETAVSLTPSVFFLGQCQLIDSNVQYGGHVRIADDATSLSLYADDNSNVAAANPFTWATGDDLIVDITVPL